MNKINVIYGSTTGATQSAAETIAKLLDADCVEISNATAESFKAPVLILGTSTWGCGDLQDDWQNGLSLLENADLSNTKVALFGQGDQYGFGDTYVNGMAQLCQVALSKGATILGKTSAEGYSHTASEAEKDGVFCGLALDDSNQADLTDSRIAAWVEQLKAELG